MNSNNADRIERRAMVIGAIGNLSMAVIAWFTYWYSNSEAVLLDGNYSLIVFIGMVVALSIARIKTRRTETFPLGQFFYESLYSFIKGLMILGVIVMAVATSVVRILLYSRGSTENIPALNPEPILVYASAMVLLSFFLSGYYRLANRRIGGQSSILWTDGKASFVDGVLSLGILVGVFFLRNANAEGGADFVPYLADSIITLVLSVSLVAKPIQIIRESVIELALGKLQNEEEYQACETAIREVCEPEYRLASVHMSKTGSRYLAVAILRPADGGEMVSLDTVRLRRQEILARLSPRFPHLMVELVPRL